MRRLPPILLKTSPHMSTPTRRRTTTTTTTPKKLIVIMGATGCGKSKLSIDLSSHLFPTHTEIINSDKIQIYRGLPITTNKIPPHHRRHIPHHLINHFSPTPSHPSFSPSDFRSAASLTISLIHSRHNLPFLVGGSNSFIHSLLTKTFNPDIDIFNNTTEALCKELRYQCCFIWVDVSFPVLHKYLDLRVDEMLGSGMLEELSEYFNDPERDKLGQCGLDKAIGVPEFEGYFRKYEQWRIGNGGDEVEKRGDYEAAVGAVKANTRRLAKRQLGKILRLRDGLGWDVKRVDATAAFTAAMEGTAAAAAEVWEREVVEPSVKIVKQFLMDG